ncbi:MAG: thioredoxin-dependent thiol peroxidase [Bacteroidetes bacterium]|nr:thioredoxin-dependent thiol peroxidase [Bacteroidota bacterium]
MTHLSEGEAAPEFFGPDQDGNIFSNKDFMGKKTAFYFYPHDNTPTCTIQACNLRDHFDLLKKEGIQVIGISTDDEKSHTKFRKKYILPFPLIADKDHAIATNFGVWAPKKFMGREFIGMQRTTFLIDEKGIIRKIIHKPKSRIHAQEISDAWKDIN